MPALNFQVIVQREVEDYANAGVPREQIVLAYAGETLPTTKEPNA